MTAPVPIVHPILWGRLFLSHHFRTESPVFHYELVDLVFCDDPKVALAAPRGHAKSTITSLLSVLYGAATKKFRYCLIVSDSSDQAEEMLSEIRNEIDENERIRDVYPHMRRGKVWNKTTLQLIDGTIIRALGRGKRVRGRKRGGVRPDLVIGDDLENDEQVASFEQRQKLRKWFRSALIPAMDPGGKVRIVGTILHSDSLLARLLRNMGWTRRKWRALSDTNKALWEEWQPAEKLLIDKEEARREGLLAQWYQEFQNQPMADEESPFRPEFFKYFDALPTKMEDGTKAQFYRSLYIDPAISLKEKADFTGFTVVYATPNGYWYIVEAFRRKCNPSDILEIAMRLQDKHDLDIIGIESVAYQACLAHWLEERAQDNMKYLNIHPTRPAKGDKRSRILALQPYYRAGRIFTRDSISSRLEEELLNIDAVEHDDLADSLAGHLDITIRPMPPKKSKAPKDPRARAAWEHRKRIAAQLTRRA